MLGNKIKKLIRGDQDIPEMIRAICREDSSIIYVCQGPNALNLPLLMMGVVLDLHEFEEYKIVSLDKELQKKTFTELLCAERLEDTDWIQIEKIEGEHTHTMWIWR